MRYYVLNRMDRARVHLLQNSLQLNPKGEGGDVKRIPEWARNHPDVLSLEKAGRIEVLTESEYRKRLGKPEPAAEESVKVVTPEDVAPAPAPEPEPVEEPEEADAPEPVEEPDEEVEEESVEEPALKTADEFTELKADKQREYLEGLGVEGDFSNQDKRLAAYEDYLADQD